MARPSPQASSAPRVATRAEGSGSGSPAIVATIAHVITAWLGPQRTRRRGGCLVSLPSAEGLAPARRRACRPREWSRRFPEREVAISNDVLRSVLLPHGLLQTLECCESELPVAEELRVGTLVVGRRLQLRQFGLRGQYELRSSGCSRRSVHCTEKHKVGRSAPSSSSSWYFDGRRAYGRSERRGEAASEVWRHPRWPCLALVQRAVDEKQEADPCSTPAHQCKVRSDACSSPSTWRCSRLINDQSGSRSCSRSTPSARDQLQRRRGSWPP